MTTLAQERGAVKGRRVAGIVEQLRLRMAAELYARDERMQGVMAGTVTTDTTPARLARLNQVIADGALDRTLGGAFKTYEGPVGDEAMWAQCHALGEDLVISFWSKVNPAKCRRLLVTPGDGGIPQYYLHVAGQRIVPHDGKYVQAATRIIARRAWEREHGMQVVAEQKREQQS